MRLLLDTHTLVWMSHDAPELSARAKEIIRVRSNEKFVSVGSAWELAIKQNLGKIAMRVPYREFIERGTRNGSLAMLQITFDHLDRLASLPRVHRDPFDRLLAAQALAEGMAIVSVDPSFDAYGVERIW